jgi:hypothetical protein
MLFSYVILCDFFPLYEFESDKCLPSTEDHSDSRILINNLDQQSLSNMTEFNLTNNENPSSKFGLQRHYQPTTSEIVLAVWMFTLFCEEIRQVKKALLC